ncbi:uncharacterized protein HMPREF1541_01289 [Cyphellophora europaea CBS 101466]|uniref:ThuA-like domain-containing protein n=1 Tax=Cyphellophora europaea (strain CBS 101466) TaxID=1220924 RepID=W2SGT9_CYPE1|nr:uncharacterized protein HMPREF1541_01289 [Cyphellophora europaea CBS 101466]ETN47099.1 hypothetical protein HMPREF1541_01289 [Cyphellophora europaea CBS 101466]
MADQERFNVLIFSKTSSYRHDCIPVAIDAIQGCGQQTGLFTTFASEDAEAVMTASALEKCRVVVLLHCTGDFLSFAQTQALREFLRRGNGVVATHGAAAGMLSDSWYGDLIGAHFDMHPDPEEGSVVVEEANANHEILKGCGGCHSWNDEWYNFTSHPRDNERLQILLKGDTASFQGGKMGEDHPLSWCQEFEGGRVYYTALGHFDEAYRNYWFMHQIKRGILWAAGRQEAES